MTDLAIKHMSDNFFIQRYPAPLPSAIRLRSVLRQERGGGGKYQKMGEGGAGGSQEGVTPDRQTEPDVNKGVPPPPLLFLAIVCEARAPRREGGRATEERREKRAYSGEVFHLVWDSPNTKVARLLGAETFSVFS